MSNSGPARRVLLSPAGAVFLLVLLALSVRLAFGIHYKISPDSTFYMRYAQEIGQGRFFVKLWASVPDRFLEPVYPLVIAGLHGLGCEIETAAWSISLTAGALLVVPVFLLTRRFYGDRAAWAATLSAALFPPLISYSTFLLTESTFTFLFYAAITVGWAARSGDRPLLLLAAGALASAAYQTRVIGLCLLPCLLAWPLLHSLFISRNRFRRGLASSALILFAFLVTASPYLIYSRYKVGEWTLIGGRSAWWLKVEEKESYDSPWEEGPGALPSAIEKGRQISVSLSENLSVLVGLFPKKPPAFLILAAIGFLAIKIRDPEGLFRELYLLSHFSAYLAAITFSQVGFITPFRSRYLIPLTPLVLIWVGRAAANLPGKALATIGRSESKGGRVAAGCASGLIILLLLASLWPGFTYLHSFQEKMKRGRLVHMKRKEACQWLRDRAGVPKEPILFDRRPHTAFIFGGYHHFLPERIDDAFLKYARSLGPSYLIFDSSVIVHLDPAFIPFLSGEYIPRGLRLIYQRYDSELKWMFTIYRVLPPEEVEGPAEEVYFKSDRSQPSEYFLQSGAYFLKKGFLNQAKLAYLEALRTAPRSLSVHTALGKTYLIKGQLFLGRLADRAALEKSRHHYLEALDLDPSNTLARETVRRIEDVLRLPGWEEERQSSLE